MAVKKVAIGALGSLAGCHDPCMTDGYTRFGTRHTTHLVLALDLREIDRTSSRGYLRVTVEGLWR